MTVESGSMTSSQWSDERSMVLHLILTTLAGEDTQLTIELQEFDRLQEFESAVLEQLPQIGESSTFGCELDFVCRDSQQKLADPIWYTLRDSNCFTVISSPCFEEAEHKGQIQGDAKAIRVPFHVTDRILPLAFSYVAKVRRVKVDAGYRIIGEGAWRSCQRLQIVHLDSTVISLQTRVFCRCYALRTVLAPGCKQFGVQAFEECCSLIQIGIRNDATNQLAPQAELMPRAFEKCTALRHLDLEKSEYLQLVDLSRTDITDIMGSAFAHCKHLQSLSLPRKLRIIEQEAFLKCTSLTEVSVPPTLLYIARRAFAGCTQLKQFQRTGKCMTWRGTYSRANAFLRRDNLDMPQWVRWLPRTPKDEDKWVDDSYASYN